MAGNLNPLPSTLAQSFSHVPVIDLQSLKSSSPDVRQALAKEVRDACNDVGFFYVKHHGIPEGVIDRAIDASKAYFSLPMETKLELDNKTHNFKGYSALLSGKHDHAGTQRDMHEGFELDWEEIDSFNSPSRSHKVAGANVWPDPATAPGFREAILQYYHAAVALGRSLFPLFALALDLEENWFEDKTKHSAAFMRVLHYPPLELSETDDDHDVLGIGAHTDWECFTILYQPPTANPDAPSALQVLNTNKDWIDVPPLPGTLVINLGDQFARWTNDVFKSTVHRARNPANGQHRYSIPLFFGTDHDVRLEPIPSCVSSERPSKYDVLTAGEYVKYRFQETYGVKGASD